MGVKVLALLGNLHKAKPTGEVVDSGETGDGEEEGGSGVEWSCSNMKAASSGEILNVDTGQSPSNSTGPFCVSILCMSLGSRRREDLRGSSGLYRCVGVCVKERFDPMESRRVEMVERLLPSSYEGGPSVMASACNLMSRNWVKVGLLLRSASISSGWL